MKILYHHRVASRDGQYVHIDAIVGQLRALGHEVTLVCPRVAEQSEFGSEGGWVARLKRGLPRGLYELLEFAYNLVIFLKLSRALWRHRPDFIYERYNLFTIAGIAAARIFRCPLILEVNAPLYEERSRYGGLELAGLARWSEKWVWRHADLVLPVTEVLASTIEAAGVSRDKIVVIPNGVHTEDFHPAVPPHDLPSSLQGRLIVGFSGFCREWHCLEDVIALLVEPGMEVLGFLLVGDGPARPSVEAAARKLGVLDRVHITGLVGRKEMPGWIAAMDIALQPAVVPYASPLKLLEYMAMGKAIVAPDQPNIRELLADGDNALLFPPDRPTARAEAIRKLAFDEILRQRLGHQAALDIHNKSLTWRANAERIIRLAEHLIAQGKNRESASS